MRRKHRRPTNPVMRKVDDAIDYLETKGKTIDVAAVADNAAGRLSARTLSQWIETLLTPLARRRLVARGYMVSDDDSLERSAWVEMGVDEYDAAIRVKTDNRDHVERHLKADRAVRKYLDTQRQALGREVTAGEFEDKVVAIYERYGVAA